jgi:murein DD-endopeptidase MepM/ murein hydrolase activator NlpD
MGGLAAPSPRGPGREALSWPSALAALALGALACASTPEGGEVWHLVRPGENLYRISLHYEVPVDRLVRANRIADVRTLEVGQELRVPGARRGPPEEPLLPPVSEMARSAGREVALADTTLRFDWPLRGRVSSHFGWRGGDHHTGIDIPAEKGTQVFAAESGRVVHSGRRLGDYGNVVIVKHTGAYATVYAHNRRNLVRPGEFVEKGQPIAQVGDSGNASGPHLHFEIRRHQRAHDPLLFLP